MDLPAKCTRSKTRRDSITEGSKLVCHSGDELHATSSSPGPLSGKAPSKFVASGFKNKHYHQHPYPATRPAKKPVSTSPPPKRPDQKTEVTRQKTELIQRCHDEILFLDNPDATRPETLTMAQEMVIQHRTRQLDQLVQADGSKWTKLKKDQIRLWTMINTVFRSDWLPEVKQWAPLLGKMKLGGVMGESTQLPLYRKDVELAQKISRLRLPPSNTWTILEALYGRQAVHKVEPRNSRLHEAYGEDSGVLETETVAKWIAKHGDVTVCRLFIKLGNARKRRVS
ncbi:Scaffold-type E3 ligase [Neofusicoccum ribis]|uniref:Scaffold-type E3 ligase n=1 Tax=Neofusicoccum ribis TaxID=45134 RepID=A0ABR3STC5_9PEZI